MNIGHPKNLGVMLVLTLWFFLAISYTLRTANDTYTHDFPGHVEYTQILSQQHRFPLPGEGKETHQPPLFYVIAAGMAPASSQHVRLVRLFCVLLGAAVLFSLSRSLQRLGYGVLPSSLALMFLATTPHFLFIFSTYNNDALAVFCGIGLWALFLNYCRRPSVGYAYALAGMTLAGYFTKYSFGAAWVSVVTAAFYLKTRRTLSTDAFHRLGKALATPMLAVFAWMYLHNYQTSGHWLALNTLNVPLQHLPHSALETILMPPGFTSWEWVTPFADLFLPVGKKNSLTAYLLVSSVFGEHSFQQLKDLWVWLIFWLHTLWLIAGLAQLRKTRWLTLMGIPLAVGWLSVAGYVLSQPFGSMMDFRHVAWLWFPIIVLQTHALEHPPEWLNRSGHRALQAFVLLGILVQWALILTI